MTRDYLLWDDFLRTFHKDFNTSPFIVEKSGELILPQTRAMIFYLLTPPVSFLFTPIKNFPHKSVAIMRVRKHLSRPRTPPFKWEQQLQFAFKHWLMWMRRLAWSLAQASVRTTTIVARGVVRYTGCIQDGAYSWGTFVSHTLALKGGVASSGAQRVRQVPDILLLVTF